MSEGQELTEMKGPELRGVTMKEFGDWLKANLHKTWYHGKQGGFTSKDNASPVFKYFFPSIDTRSLTIFHISTNIGAVDFRDEPPEGCETILDLLDAHIDGRINIATNPQYTRRGEALERLLQAKFPEMDYDQVITALDFLTHDCMEKLWAETYQSEGRNFDFKKKHYTYHDMKEKLVQLVEEARC